MSNRYLHKHKWIAVLLCLCFMMSFILPGYAMDGGVDAGGSDVSVSDGGSSGNSGSGDTGSGDATGGGESGSGDTGSGGSTGGTITPPTEGGTTTPPTEGGTTPPTEGGTTTPPTEGGTTTPPTEGGATTPPTEGGTTIPPTEGGTTTPPTEGGTTTPPTEGGTTTPPTEGGTTTPQQPTECTCGTTTGVHGVECPLYEDGICSVCKVAVGEHHTADCTYFPHMVGCEGEGCTMEGCACECHQPSKLYERLMACTTMAEIDEVFDSAELWEIALMSEEEMAEVETWIAELEMAEVPPELEDDEDDTPVESHIVFPGESNIVNMDDVAPFGEPVAGPVLARPMRVPGLLATNDKSDNGLSLRKTATYNEETKDYTITLEAYATGSKIITEVKKDVPTDIVLVLDQSGSMADPMSSERTYVAYENRSNSYLYQRRFNNGDDNLFYPLDDGYVEVQVTRQLVDYYESFDNNTQNSTYYDRDNRDNLFIKDTDGNYQKVTVKREISRQDYTYTYTVGGQQIAQSSGRDEAPDFGNYGPIYSAEQVYEYTYFYQLTGQDTVVIETSLGANTVPNETYYQYGTVNTSRLEALESAVTAFANSVATKAAGADGTPDTEDDINHRIAVVGFASKDGYGNNTELLSISGRNSDFVGVEYDSITDQNLIDVMQDMDTQAGQNMVQSAINALDAEGATQADLGMDMANRILNSNPVPEGEKRNRVVIMFTDGSPTSYSNFEDAVADAAINNASSIKDGGATVYSVGVFPGADATADGIAQGNDSRRENQFMQSVSSNNGTPKELSYYLSAGDADTLNSIFQQISDQIQEGGTSSTLTEEAVIKDIISEQFQLPEKATENSIHLYTEDYTADKTFTNRQPFEGTVDVNGSNVSVSGFDFSDNWCGTESNNGNTTYRGKKLIIEFTVEAKDGFLGGNNVYTNTSAGVYENSSAEQPIQDFERPQVNVPIKDITVGAVDKNVYLLGDLTADQLKENATVKVGDIGLNLAPNVDNYGLDAWQNEYVNITVEVKDAAGKVVDGLNDLVDDTTYSVSVTVTPKDTSPTTSEGETAVTKNGGDSAAINVFGPVVTFEDETVYYGEDATKLTLTDNNVEKALDENTVWKHNGVDASSVTMIGDKPISVTLTYSVAITDTANATIINSKTADIPVKVDRVYVDDKDVTNSVTFAHKACDSACGWNETVLDGDPAFLLHPKTCQLTITKKGGATGEPYVFDVYKDSKKYSEITIVGNDSETIYELPVGTYRIEEKTDWSWRYNPSYNGSVTLSKDVTSGTITCTNTNNNNKWLNGYSDVMTNIYNVITGN